MQKKRKCHPVDLSKLLGPTLRVIAGIRLVPGIDCRWPRRDRRCGRAWFLSDLYQSVPLSSNDDDEHPPTAAAFMQSIMPSSWWIFFRIRLLKRGKHLISSFPLIGGARLFARRIYRRRVVFGTVRCPTYHEENSGQRKNKQKIAVEGEQWVFGDNSAVTRHYCRFSRRRWEMSELIIRNMLSKHIDRVEKISAS